MFKLNKYTAIKNQNLQLQRDNAPIRIVYKEHKNGISFNPYLIGKIGPSLTNELLKKDTLTAILKVSTYKEALLVQTRIVDYDFKNDLLINLSTCCCWD